MARKRWEANTEITPELILFREKRKWQINLRRYVIEKSPCPLYAPYFGLDIENIRHWFECQFTGELNWDNFAKSWQFGQILPAAYFDINLDEELKLCWNFTNLCVESIINNKNHSNRLDQLGARSYFEKIYSNTGYPVAKAMLNKISSLEENELSSSGVQLVFLTKNKEYISRIENYGSFEFELLNRGRSIAEVEKEKEFLQKNIQP